MPRRRERPVWVLTRNNCPRLLSEVRIEHACYYCREGDRKWKPISELRMKDEGGRMNPEPDTQAAERMKVEG